MTRSAGFRLTTICLAAALVWPALAGSSAPNPNVGVRVVENTAARIVVQYQVIDFDHTSIELNGERYLKLAVPGEPVVLEAGAPAVPYLVRSLVIPGGSQVTVRVLDAQYYELAGVSVVPGKGNLLRTVDPETVPYTFGAAYYQDAFYPGRLAEAHASYVLRDLQGVPIAVYPFQYNPATRTLRVYTDLTVEVLPRVSPAMLQAAPRPQRVLSRAFDRLYAAHFINYDRGDRYPPLDEEGGMLIICHDPWLPNVAPLVAHKNSIGITTTAVGVSAIGNNATAIKNYIQGVYNQGNLAFVLLVGDAAQVATPTASGGSSDPSYAKLAGNDNWPDIMVGRFSAETAAQVDTQVLRTIEYEQNQATQTPWFWKGMGIASNQGAGIGDEGQADNVHMAEIRQWLLGRGYTYVDEIYDPTATKQMVTNGLNQGRGIINYCGHGSTTSWGTTGFSNSDVAALQNDNLLPFIISVACVNGQFAGYTCFAEAWLRSTRNGEPIGAVAAYMSSINQSWAPPMEGQDEFNLLYTNPNEPYHCFGTLCFAGSCSMMEDYGAGGVEMYDTWHIFGDPSLRIIGTTAPPTGLRVTPGTGLNSQGQAGGPFTPDSVTYTLENLDAAPLEYEVTKTVNWLTLTNASGTIPAGGTVSVTVSINSQANWLGNGQYADTVAFVNLTNHDGDTTRTVTLKVGVPTLQYAWTLDTNPGWTISGGQWAFGHPTGQGGQSYGFPDPNNGYTGTNVYGVNLNGDYSTTPGGPYNLTTTAIDLTDTTEVSLKFWRWLNSDYQPYVYQTISVSDNGTTWTQIWSNGSSEIKENAWSFQEYDISQYAANKPTFYVRWGYQVGSGAWAYSGWNIDDIQIWGLHAGPPLYQPGDLNCDGVVDFDDINPFVLALTDPVAYQAMYPNCNVALGDINGDGAVDFDDINPFVALLGG